MNGCHAILDRPIFTAQGLNPLQRFDAAQDWDSSSAGGMVWTFLLPGMFLVLAALLVVLLRRRWRNNRPGSPSESGT